MQGCQHHHDQNSIQRTNHNNKGTIGGILGHIQRKYVLLFYRAITLILTTFVSSRKCDHEWHIPKLALLFRPFFCLDLIQRECMFTRLMFVEYFQQAQADENMPGLNLVGVSIMVVAPATHVCRIRWKSAD